MLSSVMFTAFLVFPALSRDLPEGFTKGRGISQSSFHETGNTESGFAQ